MKTLMDYVLQEEIKMDWWNGCPVTGFLLTGLPASVKRWSEFWTVTVCTQSWNNGFCADIADDKDAATQYNNWLLICEKIVWYLLERRKQALAHSRVDGKQTENVTRYANMFGIFFNYFTERTRATGGKKSVLLNDNIQKITTPYMRFMNWKHLCAMGEQDYVLKEMKDYWGGGCNSVPPASTRKNTILPNRVLSIMPCMDGSLAKVYVMHGVQPVVFVG